MASGAGVPWLPTSDRTCLMALEMARETLLAPRARDMPLGAVATTERVTPADLATLDLPVTPAAMVTSFVLVADSTLFGARLDASARP